MKKISVNGRQFADEVIGTGSPTVVLETGIPDSPRNQEQPLTKGYVQKLQILRASRKRNRLFSGLRHERKRVML